MYHAPCMPFMDMQEGCITYIMRRRLWRSKEIIFLTSGDNIADYIYFCAQICVVNDGQVFYFQHFG